jgi:homoserine dehydrogenase
MGLVDSGAARGNVGVGLIGCGVVGSAVAQALVHPARTSEEAARNANLVGVAVRDLRKPRGAGLRGVRMTEDALGLLTDPRVDVVLEAITDPSDARRLAAAALGAGKPYVTANKQLVAGWGPELLALARDSGVPFLYEASVAAALPVVHLLGAALRGDRVRRLTGVLNGTSNFVLTEMRSGCGREEAVRRARRGGYAEADPSDDLSGRDASVKGVILARLAFGQGVRVVASPPQGIETVSTDDVVAAARAGRVLKLVTRVEMVDGAASVTAGLEALPNDHRLAAVSGARNGLVVEMAAAGTLFLEGEGAGGRPTAAAMISDLVQAAESSMAERAGLIRTA